MKEVLAAAVVLQYEIAFQTDAAENEPVSIGVSNA